jgi:hypothetical protein
MLKYFNAKQVKYAFLLSGWNLGGKEESLPTRLSILHIPNPDQEALPTFDMNAALALKSEEALSPLLTLSNPHSLTYPQINFAQPWFDSHGQLPSKC